MGKHAKSIFRIVGVFRSNAILRAFGGLLFCIAFVASCEEEKPKMEDIGYYYAGRVYDGATGERLLQYQVRLVYSDQDYKGEIDDEGRYFVGPLEEGHDFTLEIESDGYRSFLSHNPMVESIKDLRSFYYDAYLFPYELPTPQTHFYVSVTDTDEAPSGLYRLRPVGPSSLVEGDSQRPAGIVHDETGAQRWENDEDLQFQTLFGEFSDGHFSLQEEELVYGVAYEVVIFGVDGYQEIRHMFHAGMDGTQAYQLDPLTEPALALSFVSTDLGIEIDEAKVVFVFNQPIELDALEDTNEMLETLNAGFSIQTEDDDQDGETNTLAELRRGVTVTINTNRLILNWSSDEGLETVDDDDGISEVTFGDLGAIVLRPAGGLAGTSQSLAGLFGQSSVDVQLVE